MARAKDLFDAMPPDRRRRLKDLARQVSLPREIGRASCRERV